MKIPLRLIFSIFVVILSAQISFAKNKDWHPVSQTELQMKNPRVEPDADAEAIFWEVRVADEVIPRAGPRTILNHYLRIKIFTERGRENNSKIDIPFGKIPHSDAQILIKDIAARTIKPDGTIIEVNPKDIFERDIVKGSGIKLKAKAFVVPGIEAGAIIEYRWKEIRDDMFSYYISLELARDIPVQFVKYSVKPYSAPNFRLGMRIHSSNTSNHFVKDKDGFYSTTMENVPAFREEPRMPPERDVKPWLLVYYAEHDIKQTAVDYWKEKGKESYKYHKSVTKVNDDIRRAAAQAIGDAVEPEEKIERIFNFCRKNIKNVADDASGLTVEQRKNFKENKDITDALKRGQGSWHDINMLFAAMLMSAGFEARVANASIRTNPPFNKELANDYFLRTENIAVKVGNEWKFYDPATLYLPFGMLYWTEEGQEALISDEHEPFWVSLPKSSAEQSKQKRTAKLRLAENGTIDGDVRIEYTGHLAQYYKEYYDDNTPAEREKSLTEMIKRRTLNTAEITNISIENVQDSEAPLVFSFKINIPSYIERTGKRIFLQPNIFERNTSAMFITSSRKNNIFFEYPWTEDDNIIIELPQGYSLESADSPAPVKDRHSLGLHETKIMLSDDKKILTYRRNFSFSGNGTLVFPAEAYPILKGLFESYHKANTHAVTLMQNSPQPTTVMN